MNCLVRDWEEEERKDAAARVFRLSEERDACLSSEKRGVLKRKSILPDCWKCGVQKCKSGEGGEVHDASLL